MNMNINVLTKEPEILTDKKGNSFRLIPEEDLKKIAISKEQSKLGLTFKEFEKKEVNNGNILDCKIGTSIEV